MEFDGQNALPREMVLDYLETRIGSSSLVMSYLDHCIFAWNETRTKFHDCLINKYREKIRLLMAEYQLENCRSQKLDNTIEILDENEVGKMDNDDDNNNKNVEQDYRKDFKEYHLRPEPAGQEPGDLGLYRRKLMKLLRESDHYSTETLPTYLLHDGLFDERAIVMGKIGNHQEALVIYVHILQDLQRAEEYCHMQYNQIDKKQQNSSLAAKSSHFYQAKDVFLLLFQQCLKAPDSTEIRNGLEPNENNQFNSQLQLSKSINTYLQVNFNSTDNKYRHLYEKLTFNVRIAIAILARHSTRINLIRAIEMLPPELPLAALVAIMTQSMEHITSQKNYVQILCQLLHAQRLRAHQARIRMEQTNRLLLTNLDICQVCTKKIGKRSVLVVISIILVSC